MLDWYAIPRPPMLNNELSFAARGLIAYVLCFWDKGEIVIPKDVNISSEPFLELLSEGFIEWSDSLDSYCLIFPELKR